MQPGSIVRCRHREWVMMPSPTDDVIVLRPLTGTSDDAVHIHRQLMELLRETIPSESVTPAAFPFPTPDDVSNISSLHLLWQSARLVLREGASPFRSFGKLSIRPRPYQLVPLLMALRLDPVRLFIADDVGVGKTVEALLIARELLERGEIRRFCVLCPPYLCDQWAGELSGKFNLDPVIIRSGTIGQLERQVRPGFTVYEHFPVQVISIDFAKTDRNRAAFLRFCPELAIVDEAHGAAAASRANQQDRHELLKEIASDPARHLVLLTATPHSGIETAFRSLLGLLQPEFGNWDIHALDDEQRAQLARHFVQRTRLDIARTWNENTCFPRREPHDECYTLSPLYRELFKKTYAFCSEMVRTGEQLEKRRRRVRYWGALALLCCVMSSPAAALRALQNRFFQNHLDNEVLDDESIEGFNRHIFDTVEERPDDEVPSRPIDLATSTLIEVEQEQLRELEQLARQLQEPSGQGTSGQPQDTKLTCAAKVARQLIQDGFHPIFWCRYVATAEYLAGHLRNILPPEVQVVCLTGRMGDDERQARLANLEADQPRVLVATDCLSEGTNLQELFNAVVHYDLPWNPNRLEQREGRVDRYGQKAGCVRTVRIFGQDNPVDGVLLKVLLDKAREIHKTLGTYVPVPEAGETVTQAVLEALFLRHEEWKPQWEASRQLSLDLELPQVNHFHEQWQDYSRREHINRTRFAQRAIKTSEVECEIDATDAVLGGPAAVRDFFLTAASSIKLPVSQDRKNSGVFVVNLTSEAIATVPQSFRPLLPTRRGGRWRVTFDAPAPDGVEYIGRNHPFIDTLSRFIFERLLFSGKSLSGSGADSIDEGNTFPDDGVLGSRCGVMRTSSVNICTTILLLRARYLLTKPGLPDTLCEEVLLPALNGSVTAEFSSLSPEEIIRLLSEARPNGNLSRTDKQGIVAQVLSSLGDWGPETTGKCPWGTEHPVQKSLHEYLSRRALELTEAHRRLRRAIRQSERGLTVRLQPPPDLLGFLVLLPATSGQ